MRGRRTGRLARAAIVVAIAAVALVTAAVAIGATPTTPSSATQRPGVPSTVEVTPPRPRHLRRDDGDARLRHVGHGAVPGRGNGHERGRDRRFDRSRLQHPDGAVAWLTVELLAVSGSEAGVRGDGLGEGELVLVPR